MRYGLACRLALPACLALLARSIGAQCPDGSPPPCKGAINRPAAEHRANPPLNERAWIVVPFGNAMRATDLEWLRDASVNLLSLDLSRWTDISVVDDKRVTDLVRTLPTARAAQSLSLEDGLALARRAGAGMLVMGDFFKVGKGARLVANVFNVRSGARLRSITQQALDADSLLAAFGPLARGVLAVPPPGDASVGAIGTTSVDAYQEYLQGVTAFNQFELGGAKAHFRNALKLDSTFALAHYKLSVAIHWDVDSADTTERVHALAAARLGGTLPPRERALIRARVASATGDYERACATLRSLVERDSSDVEATYGVGECEYHAAFLVPEAIDAIRGRMRGNWNLAIAAFRRVLQLDPSYHPAFEHVLDMLGSQVITMCPPPAPTGCGNDPTVFSAWVIREADSLVVVPVRGTVAVKDVWRERQIATRSGRRNLEVARRIAQEWSEAAPTEARAHLNLAIVQMLLGEVESAYHELLAIGATADRYSRQSSLRRRVEATILLGRAGQARAALDTLWRLMGASMARERTLGQYYATLGQLKPIEASLRRRAVDEGWAPEKLQYWLDAPRFMLGRAVDSLSRKERAYWAVVAGDTACPAGRPRCRATQLWPSLAYAARAPRAWWPPGTVKASGFRFFVAWELVADTSLLHATRRMLDSVSTAKLASDLDDQGMRVQVVEADLAMRDSAAALRDTRIFVDWLLPSLTRMSTTLDDEWSFLLIPRMQLLRADLALALGYRDEARTWYARVLDLWATADPEFQPTVARIRAALAALTPP
ncbi:MAG: protein kinase [Gemmatimonadetes bacterium]|nr:protein kinase [Gemmatimonadota bacterium]